MKLFLDCLPCLLNQALEISRMTAQGDFETQQKIMEQSIDILSRYREYRNAPELARDIHSAVKRISGVADPYSEIKKTHIKQALSLKPDVEEFLKGKGNSLYWILKASASGNVMDAAINRDVDIVNTLHGELEAEFAICDIGILEERLKSAGNILIIGDNAGETVFDTYLAGYFKNKEVIYAVRSAPVINDATFGDAHDSGLGEHASIVSSGCDAPGLILEEASPEFKEILNEADVIIAKGQGNFEALSDSDIDVFYLLKAKCPMIARRLGTGLQSYVFAHSSGLKANG